MLDGAAARTETGHRGWAIITGASSGLGSALADRLAAEGYNLLLVARRRERLEEVSTAVIAARGCSTLVAPVDLTETDTIIPAIESALRGAGVGTGEVSLIVNNAGSGFHGAFSTEDPEKMHRGIRLNIDAPAAMTRWGVSILGRGGTICNVASVAAFTPGPYMASYYAAKAWLLALGESVAEEVRPEGIRVVTCCPGPFASEFHQTAGINPDRLGNLPSADRIARGVVQAICRGRTVAPIGLVPWVWAILGPRLPRSWSGRIIGALQRRRAS